MVGVGVVVAVAVGVAVVGAVVVGVVVAVVVAVVVGVAVTGFWVVYFNITLAILKGDYDVSTL